VSTQPRIDPIPLRTNSASIWFRVDLVQVR
jgi:hypothetical protein